MTGGKERKLSHAQLGAVLWAGALAPAAELLPGLLLDRAGRDAWLAVLAGGLLTLGVWSLLFRLGGRLGSAAVIRDGLGPVSGGLFLAIYMVWMELMLAVRLRMCAERLLRSGERDGSLGFFLVVLTLLLYRLGLGRLDAFGRAGQVFLAVLLTASAGVLGLSLGQMRPERLFPPEGNGAGMLSAALTAAGVLGWTLPGIFLGGWTTGEPAWSRGQLARGLTGCGLLAAAQGVILANTGAELAAGLDAPFFFLAKSIGVEGAFQRVESVVAALWIFADLTMAGLLVFAQRAVLQAIGGERWERPGAAVLTAGAAIAALWGCREPGMPAVWERELIPAGNLILAPVAGLLLALARTGQRGKNGDGEREL